MQEHKTSVPQYPIFLKVLLAVSVFFLGSLGLLILSLIVNMLGFAYGMINLISAATILEQMGILSLGLSVLIGGVVSLIGGTVKAMTPLPDIETQGEKQKNEDRQFDIRDYGLTVEDVLEDMSMVEREYLAEKLAESRLAIREDGTLIPQEQAEKLSKVERFINE